MRFFTGDGFPWNPWMLMVSVHLYSESEYFFESERSERERVRVCLVFACHTHLMQLEKLLNAPVFLLAIHLIERCFLVICHFKLVVDDLYENFCLQKLHDAFSSSSGVKKFQMMEVFHLRSILTPALYKYETQNVKIIIIKSYQVLDV
jgi:hypothetical protein